MNYCYFHTKLVQRLQTLKCNVQPETIPEFEGTAPRALEHKKSPMTSTCQQNAIDPSVSWNQPAAQLGGVAVAGGRRRAEGVRRAAGRAGGAGGLRTCEECFNPCF